MVQNLSEDQLFDFSPTFSPTVLSAPVVRQFPRALGVTCPFSMLRVQVVDQGKSNAVTRVWAHVWLSQVVLSD